MAMLPRHLVVCVDDFGLHEGVNQAVFELLRLQRISAVSCLVDGPTWASGAAALQALAYPGGATLARQADVGLHLNLTECLDPVAQAAWPSRPLGALIRAAYLRQLDVATLRVEVARQWDRFVAVWGRVPDFIDGHQHVHQLPQVRDALMAVLDARLSADGPRPWLRRCRAPGWRVVLQGAGLVDTAKAQLIGALGSAALAQLAHARGLRTSGHLLGVYPFDADGRAYLRRWSRWLTQIRPHGDVLMCHPAQPEAMPAGGGDVIGASRAMEYKVLTSGAWAALLTRSGTDVALLA